MGSRPTVVTWHYKAFVSYVRQNETEVLKRIQALRVLCVDVYQDLPRSVSILIRYFPIPHAKQI